MILEAIQAKVTRAKQHISDFQLALSSFAAGSPYAVSCKEDLERGKRVYYISKADRVPQNLAAIAADIIQNLRSPLDHVSYQLVLAARGGGSAKPNWKVYYPISGSATAYPATRNGTIKGVRQEIVDAIDATEPYKGGKGHALWQLNELNKPDKHELLIGTGVLTSVDISVDFRQMFTEMGRQIDIPPLFLREAAHRTVLNVGTELYIEPLDKKMAQERTFSFDISLYSPGVIGPEPALKTFHDFANLVDGIVTTLGRFLPG